MSYALGILPSAEAERFEQHLLHCPACQQELEEAAPALDALATIREQFVLRAHKEKEDFESQFERLARDARTAVRREKTASSRNWMESLWAILWGRRWIVGAAGAIAFAALFGLRHGLEPVSPPIVKNGTPVAPRQLSVRAADSISSTPMASNDYVPEMKAEKKFDITSVPMRLGLPEEHKADISPAPEGQISPPEQSERRKDLNAGQAAGRTEELAEVVIEESLAMPARTGHEVRVTAATKQLVVRSSYPAANLSQFADIALGKFDPQQYENLSQTREVGSAAAVPESAYYMAMELDRAKPNARPNADSLFASQRYGEARDLYEQRWKEDSTDVRLQVMIGIASLAQGDYEQARTSLWLAYHRLPPSTQKDDIGLLLARADILRGRLDEARNRLQNLARTGSDPERRELAQQAMAKMDSLRNVRPPEQAPK